MSAGQALTAIKGGINRARIKGAARQDTLYNLLNGYVTVGNTIKVRGGTIRNTNLAPTTGALATKGLVAYAGSRHVFAEKSVAVPAGYTLHVVNHPATSIVNGVILALTAGSNAGNFGWSTSSGLGAFGAIAPSAILSPTQTVKSIVQGHSGGYTIAIRFQGNQLRTTFTSVDIVGDDNVSRNYVSATSTSYFYDGANNETVWAWTTSAAQSAFSSGTKNVTFNGMGSVTTITPIPLKEIHFAAPFMGFLYVVAEFTTDAGSGLGTVFHYWIQTSGKWSATTVYQIGQVVSPTTANGYAYKAVRISAPNPSWAQHTLHNDGDLIEPTVPNGYFYTQTSHLGTSPQTGTVEPTWPTVEGQTVLEDSESDNDAVVTNAAPQPAANQPSPGTGTKYGNPYLAVG